MHSPPLTSSHHLQSSHYHHHRCPRTFVSRFKGRGVRGVVSSVRRCWQHLCVSVRPNWLSLPRTHKPRWCFQNRMKIVRIARGTRRWRVFALRIFFFVLSLLPTPSTHTRHLRFGGGGEILNHKASRLAPSTQHHATMLQSGLYCRESGE